MCAGASRPEKHCTATSRCAMASFEEAAVVERATGVVRVKPEQGEEAINSLCRVIST